MPTKQSSNCTWTIKQQALQLQLSPPPLSNKTPQELEDILARVHDLPVSSVLQEERLKIQAYVVDMLQATKDQQQEVALKESQRGEDAARQELLTAKKQIEALKTKLSLVSSRKDHGNVVT